MKKEQEEKKANEKPESKKSSIIVAEGEVIFCSSLDPCLCVIDDGLS